MTTGSDETLEKALSWAFSLDKSGDSAIASAAPRSSPLRIPAMVGRYPVEALVGRGGMGLVLRARDTELDRPVALKILHEHLGSDPEMVRRFVDEAKVEGGLEHPGVVPVHEMGRTEDGRPYFTMKLVEGETLAGRLAARKSPSEDRLGFLAMFEKLCQIVGYAHARGVAHLDLKPANILVGGFGEIVVTDWGFAAKVAGPGDSAAGAADRGGARIVGTPAYMSPEQARGDVARIGPRSDVFALGAVLCEILTGEPAYKGDSATELFLAASRAWLDDAHKRLDGCGADQVLVALARRCLAQSPADRLPEAGEVADQIGLYLRSLEERAQALAIEAAEARTRAAAERRQRRLYFVLAVVVVMAVLLASGAWLWSERDRAARVREDDRLAAGMGERVRLLAERARGSPEPDPALWVEPIRIARQAADLARARGLGTDVRERLEHLAEGVEAERAAAVQDDLILKDLRAIHERLGDVREMAAKDRDYAALFRRSGIDVEALGPEHAARRIAASPLREHFVTALDDWIHARQISGRSDGAALIETANRADPDEWRVRVRTASVARDVEGLLALAASADSESRPAESQIVLATSLKRAGRVDEAIAVLVTAERHHPDDYEVHHEHGMIRRTTGNFVEAIRQFSMALALRPRSAHAIVDLGQAFLQAGDFRSGERYLEDARRIDPGYAPAWHYLGALHLQRRDHAAAEKLLRRAVELDPGWTFSRNTLAVALRALGRFDAATAELRESVKRDPGIAEAWGELGHLLIEQGRFAEAKDCLAKCHALGTARGEDWKHPSAAWLSHVDALIAAEAELRDPDFVLPMDRNEQFELAKPAFLIGRSLTAARIMESLLPDPATEVDVPIEVHLLAARAAASAATGAGTENATPHDAPALRERASMWLRAALDSFEDLEASAPERAGVAEALERLLVDPSFAGVRDKDRLAGLPPAESTAWAALWERLRKSVGIPGR